MTYLSAKTLRHYHAVGLLAPAEVDRSSGYRYYTTDQVPTAHLIKRLRDLDMPVDECKEVVAGQRSVRRHDTIAAHLARMEQRLRDTTDAIASLRELLTDPRARNRRRVPHRLGDAQPGRSPTRWRSTTLARGRMGRCATSALAVGRDAQARAAWGLTPRPFFEQGGARSPPSYRRERWSPRSCRISEGEVPAACLCIAMMWSPRRSRPHVRRGRDGWSLSSASVLDGPIRERFLGRDPDGARRRRGAGRGRLADRSSRGGAA